MIANMLCDKNPNAIATGLFIRRRKLIICPVLTMLFCFNKVY